MNEVAHTWGDLLAKRRAQDFIGRENVIQHFRLNCLDTTPRDLIFVLQGIPGVGKSTTMLRLREIAGEYGIFSTYIDSSIATPVREKAVLRLMHGIARQFAENGIPLTQFDERYHEFITVMHQISEDEQAPGRLYDVIGGLQDRDPWHQKAWDTYLRERYSVNACALVQQPVDTLTQLFVHDLNTWALVKRIILCIDDWQLLDEQVGTWLLALISNGELSTKIWMILATRAKLTADWDRVRPILKLYDLVGFTELETRTYLTRYGIEDGERASDIVVFTNGLPILVKLLSSARQGIAGDLALSPLDRYFKWLSRAQRRVVLLASVPRCIDTQVLGAVLGEEGGKWFDWLKQANLLNLKGDVWIYHPALRQKFLVWVRREMYEASYAAHVALRAYYLRIEHMDEEKLTIPADSFNPAIMEYLYHGLMIGESGAIRNAVLTFISLVRRDYTIAGELVEIWQQTANEQDTTNAVVEWALILSELWDDMYTGNWQASAVCCESILKREALDAGVKSEVTKLLLAIQARFPQPYLESVKASTLSEIQDDESPTAVSGIAVPDVDSHMTIQQYSSEHLPLSDVQELVMTTTPSARADLDTGQYRPEDVSAEKYGADQVTLQDVAIEQTGDTVDDSVTYQTADEWCQYADNHIREKAYKQAIKAYAQALSLDPEHSRAHFGKARAFSHLDDLHSAIKTYENVLNYEPNNIYALRNSGWLLMRQQQYLQALKNYENALSLVPDDVGLICASANAHYRLKDYASALKNYNEVIRRDSTYTEAYLNRGVTHAVLREYRRAIADFNQAITLDPDNGFAYHHRGRAYAKLQQLALAHNDFSQALERIPHNVGIYIDMGLLYSKQGEFEKALDAYHKVNAQDPENATAYYNAACAAALMGDSAQACRNLVTAIELHPPYREMATTDTDFAAIRHNPAFQKCVLG